MKAPHTLNDANNIQLKIELSNDISINDCTASPNAAERFRTWSIVVVHVSPRNGILQL